MSYTVHQAKTNLSRLLKEAEEGKEVIISRGKQPVARLVAIAVPVQASTPEAPKSKSGTTRQNFEPMTDEELAELGLE